MEGSLDRKQRGIPKLRELLRRQRRESEGQIDVSPDIDFVYGDADTFAAEIAELYTYTEETDFLLNKEVFERDLYWQDVEPSWSELAEKERVAYLLQLFDRVEAADSSTRLAAARILLYLVQGNFGVLATEQEQQDLCKQNVFLLYKMGIYPVIVQLLNMETENCHAVTSALHKPSISIVDSVHLRIYLNILYTFVETMRCSGEGDTEEMASSRKTFRAELGQPITGEDTLAVILFEMVLKFCAGSSPHFPIKKVLLLLWKTILVSLGGMEKLAELKRESRISAGLSPSYEEQCPTLTIIQEKRLPVPQTPPPPGDSSSESADEGIERDEEEGTIRLRPKIREKDIDIFLDNSRSKFVGYQLRSDRSTLAGLPESIHEAVEVLKNHLYISLAEKHIQDEEEAAKRPLTKGKVLIPNNPTEKLYQAMLPNLPQYMIALLKILLAAAPTAKAKTDSINILADVLPEDMPSTVLHSMRLGIDVNRHKEIIVKSISGILLLLLKHFKLNHVYQFEFMSQHLVFANCIPLILKFLNQNLSAFITAKNTIPLLDFPLCVLGDPLELTAENLENVETEGCCWRNLFSCINLVRILQKLTKWKHSRTMMLVVFKSAPILKRALKVKHEMMQLYVLKLLKAQTKYLGRNWRKSNMKTMSAIYQKVRHRLNDDWAYGNDLDARPWDFQAEESALRTCVDRFNNRRYALEIEAEGENDNLSPVDCNAMSVLGQTMELGDEFKKNYEKWLDREVFSTAIDWDQLCGCPSAVQADTKSA